MLNPSNSKYAPVYLLGIIQSPLLNYKNFKSTNYIFASEISHISHYYCSLLLKGTKFNISRDIVRMFVIKCSYNSLFENDGKFQVLQENSIFIAKFKLTLELNNTIKTKVCFLSKKISLIIFIFIKRKDFIPNIGVPCRFRKLNSYSYFYVFL